MTSKKARHRSRFTLDDSPRLRAARRLFATRDFQRALQEFDRAVAQQPSNVQALIDAARAYGARYDIETAGSLLKRALNLAPKSSQVLHMVGETYRMLEQFDLALPHFEQARSLGDQDPDILHELGFLYERFHRLDESNACAEKLLSLRPDWPAPYLLKATIQRRRKDLSGAESTLRSVIKRQPQDFRIVAQAWGDLALVLDEAESFDAAWDAALRCKEVLRRHERPHREAADVVLSRFRKMLEAITARHFDRWRESELPSSPQEMALLTGFPRSGTTLLGQVLGAHPQVLHAEEREIFSAEVFPALGAGFSHEHPVEDVLDQLPPASITRQRRRYYQMMEAVLREQIGDRLLLDKNPSMNLMIPAVLRLFPETKLIVALRDPRDVVLSCFLRYLPLNPVSVCYLTPERTAERYALDMQAWLKCRELIEADWLELRYEDVVSDLRGQTQRALELLELRWDDVLLGWRDHAAKTAIMSPTYEQVTKPIHSGAVGRWRNYEERLAPVLKTLQPFVREFGYD